MQSLQLLHITLFGGAAVGCGLALRQARTITHKETRYGLSGLVVITGIWAATQALIFSGVSGAVAVVTYQVGLICGLSSVIAWLYFCSAYTGHDFHRTDRYRYATAVVFLGVVGVKLTNRIHGQYFATEAVTEPFRYTRIELLTLHWAVAGVVYSLTAIGFYMLFRTFVRSGIRTTKLTVLVGLTSVPVALNMLSVGGVAGLVGANYEPIGVAAFALGTVYTSKETFERVRWSSDRRLLEQINDAVLVVDEDGSVQRFNAAAAELFDSLESGVSLSIVLPDGGRDAGETLDAASTDSGEILSDTQNGESRYYLLNQTDVPVGPGRTGQALVVSDVTEMEQQRRQLDRQSEQLEGLAAAIAHELRNTVGIAHGNLRLAEEAIAEENQTARELLSSASEATERVKEVVEELQTVARLSQQVTRMSTLSLEATVRAEVEKADTSGLSVDIVSEGEFEAASSRWTKILRNVIRLATETGASELSVSIAADTIRFRTDGASLPSEHPAALFEYGTAVPHAEAGMLGPAVRTLGRAHGWEVSAHSLEPSGIEVRLTGVTRPSAER
jgi:signal transduction histidine kinase